MEADIIFQCTLIGELVSAAADVYIEAWWSANGGILFAACGGLTLQSWRFIPQCTRRNLATACAACALANAVLFFIDTLITICAAKLEEGSTTCRANKSPKCVPYV